jgi:tRNA A37 threonylcarbamoyladenosine dehydratase
MKLRKPKIPHIKLECVLLCGLGGVGGMIAPIQF